MHLCHDPEVHPVALDLYALARLGAAYYDWEPETIFAELSRGAGPIPEVNRHKICAIKTTQSFNTPYESWSVFEKVVAAFNSVIPDFETMQKPSLGEVLVGVGAMEHIRAHPISDEVHRYIAAALLTDGVFVCPGIDAVNAHLRRECGWPELHDAVLSSLQGSHKKPDNLEVARALSEQVARVHDGVAYSIKNSDSLSKQLEQVQ